MQQKIIAKDRRLQISNLNKYKNLTFEEQIRLPLNVQMKLSAAGHLKTPSGPVINTRPYGIPTYENGRAKGMNTFNKNLNNALAAIRRDYPQAAVPAAAAVNEFNAIPVPATMASSAIIGVPTMAPALQAGPRPAGLRLRVVKTRNNLTGKNKKTFSVNNPLLKRGKGGRRRRTHRRRR